MATKEAIVILLDVGASMTRRQDSIEWAIKAMTLLIQQKILFKPKDDVSLILFGTKETKNQLEDKGYTNICVVRDLEQPDIELLRYLQQFTPDPSEQSDYIDALVVSLDLILQKRLPPKSQKRVFLVTDAASHVETDNLDKLIEKFVQLGVKLNVIGVGFSDQDEPTSLSEIKQEISDDGDNPPPEKVTCERNQKIIRYIAESVHGAVVPVTQAIEMMSYFRSKSVSQRPTYAGFLELSQFVSIPIKTYIKTKEQTFPTLKKMNATDPEKEVKMDRKYYSIDDLDHPIESSQSIKAYTYGKTLVPISNSDKEALDYKSERSLQIIGFTRASSVPRYHFMGPTEVVASAPDDVDAATAISALVHALEETDSVAIVRFVKRKNGTPILGALYPCIKPDNEYFYLHKLPYAEDIRQFPFPPLDKERAKPNLVPSADQLAAAEALIDSLDLSENATDEEENTIESLNPRYTYNPVLQRLYQTLHQRALDPSLPLGPLDPVIEKYVNPDEELFARSKPVIENFRKAFPLEKIIVEEKPERQYWSNLQSNLQPIQLDSYADTGKKQKTNIDVDSILSGATNAVGSINPVKDFRDMLARRDVDLVDDAIAQMQTRITQLINDSIRDQFYPKAVDCLSALREGCIKEEEHEPFNRFLRSLKSSTFRKKKMDLWGLVVTKNLSLIHSDECEDSDITPSESEAFLVEDIVEAEPEPEKKPFEHDEVDDLLEMAD